VSHVSRVQYANRANHAIQTQSVQSAKPARHVKRVSHVIQMRLAKSVLFVNRASPANHVQRATSLGLIPKPMKWWLVTV
jgi:hypothetical protein